MSDYPHRRKSDLSRPAKISDFLRTWGGFVYPLFTLFTIAGFIIVSPKAQFDGIRSDIKKLQEADSASRIERSTISRKLDIIIVLACEFVPTRDIRVSQLESICPDKTTQKER
jgi:hypothetical protein